VSEKLEEKRGCFGRLTFLFVVLLLGGFAAALYFIAQPQTMDDVSGYRVGGGSGHSRDLRKVMENAVERGYPVTISEAEINRYIRRTLKTRQGGTLSKWVSIKGVAVRLEDGRAEIIIERRIAKHDFTVSMYLNIEQTEDAEGSIKTALNLHGGPFFEQVPWLNRGGRFGQLVVPQGFLVLVLDSFRAIAKDYESELNLAFEKMTRIRIEKNQLVLDPRLPGNSMGLGDF
jgi:hypothetical protein